MQLEQLSQQPPQEIPVTRLVPEQALSALQEALIHMLQTLPIPIAITKQTDTHQRAYYTYQVGEPTAEHPFGIAMAATPNFLDAVQFSLEKASQPRPNSKEEQE